MAELTFAVGERATLDLRDSTGEIAVRDWDGATMKIAAQAETSPYVLRDGDTFRVRLTGGGTISLPIGLPAEVLTPAAVKLRVMRAGGETDVRPLGGGEGQAAEARDFGEFAEVMSQQGRRILQEVARAVRVGPSGLPEDVSRKIEEASERIDETARRAAERIQREVERTVSAAERYEQHGQRAAAHAEERARRIAERIQRQVERASDRGERRAGRGASWFAEKLDEWASAQTRTATATRPKATEAERLAIMQMLQDGKITAEQAAHLLDALER